jgi:hypothetical protein
MRVRPCRFPRSPLSLPLPLTFTHSNTHTHTHTHTGPLPPHQRPPFHAPPPRELERGTSDMVARCVCPNEAGLAASRPVTRRETEQRKRHRRRRRRRRRERPAILRKGTFLLSPLHVRHQCVVFLPRCRQWPCHCQWWAGRARTLHPLVRLLLPFPLTHTHTPLPLPTRRPRPAPSKTHPHEQRELLRHGREPGSCDPHTHTHAVTQLVRVGHFLYTRRRRRRRR